MRARFCTAAAWMFAVSPANAVEFEVNRLQGVLNLDVSFGGAYRVEDRDPELIAVGNGGDSGNVNGDDGDLNYDEGMISQMVRGTGELIVVRENWGAYARGIATYDWAQSDELDRTALSSSGEALVGNDVELREHYLAASVTVRGTPFYFRLGDQVLSWNETSFIRDGIDLVSPFDAATALQPASQSVDARVPQGMLWIASSLTEVLAIEAYYQYEWKPVTLPPIGSYFSPADIVGGDRVGDAVLSTAFSDLGTDLDEAFELPPDTLGVDRRFLEIPGRGFDRPRDTGQWGVSVVARFMDGLATKIGAYYVHYHSRLPIVSAVTGDANAVAATSEDAVAARAAALVPAYIDTGLDPATAATRARSTAETLTTSAYMNAAGVFVEYPEDIDAIGGSVSFSLLRTGTLVAAEVSRHFDAPYQRNSRTVLNAALSPVLFAPSLGTTTLGEYGPDAHVQGFERGDRTQGSFSVTQLFGPRAGASQVLADLSFGWVHANDMPGLLDPRATRNSWGYRAIATATYTSVLGAVNVAPRAVWGRDVKGTTPGPTSTFLDDRTLWSVGVSADYLLRFETDLSYTAFSGGGSANLLRDRDYVELRFTYSF